MTPEQEARQLIDDKLRQAGWVIQDYNQLNPAAGMGVVIREFPFKRGFADYLLMVNRKAVGVIEAKPVGTTLGGVDWQSEKYVNNLPEILQYDFDKYHADLSCIFYTMKLHIPRPHPFVRLYA